MARASVLTTLLVLAACLTGTWGQDVVQLGTMLPLTGSGCLAGNQFRRAANAAVSYVTSQSWWTDTQMQLQLNIMNTNSSFQAWEQAVAYTASPCSAGSTCLIGALLGPFTSSGTQHVEFVARQKKVPLVGFSATSPLLSSLPFFARTCPSDSATAGALYRALQLFGWKQVALVHDDNQYARAYDLEMQHLAQEDGSITITSSVRFDGLEASIVSALNALKESLTRVVVVIGYPQDAEPLLEKAAEMGMTGKGWTWVGSEWVSELYFQVAGDTDAFKSADTGGIGVSPSLGNIATYDGGSLMKMTPTADELALCPALGANGVQALSPDPYVPFVFDAVLAVAHAAAELRGCSSPGVCTTPLHQLTSEAVFKKMMSSPKLESPLTGAVEFTSTGDRVADLTQFSLKNVQDGQVKVVGTAKADSGWSLTETVIWAGGSTEIPSDRALPEIGLLSGLFSCVITAMLFSLFVGYAIARPKLTAWFPSSGVMVVVGILIGGIVRVLDTHLSNEFSAAVKFDSQFFSLVFLPIIIFQSGYALRKHPFFSQLGSILMYATVGTVVSTFMVGGVLFQLGQMNVVTRMSLEESLAFGALISAVDPVSTLAQFGSLNVPSSLGALVYGESVINDAVAIVLYRTFTGFLTEEITGGAVAVAALSFFGILCGSVLIGAVVALLCAICLKWVDVTTTRHAAVAEAAALILFSYLAFTTTEALHLSGIVASLACGICMNHYTKKNLTPDGKVLCHQAFMVLADVSETVVFFQVGLNVLLFPGHFSFPLIAMTLLLCLVARLLNVYPLSWILNCFRKDKIPSSHQTILWLSGLRGAIAYALSVQFPSHLVDDITTTTSVVVVFTILVLGGSTRPVIHCLQVEEPRTAHTHEKDVKMTQEAKKRSRFKRWMASFDARVIRPLVYKSELPTAVKTDSPLHTALDSSDEGEGIALAEVGVEMPERGPRRRGRNSAPGAGAGRGDVAVRNPTAASRPRPPSGERLGDEDKK